jgi:hypothetical protein
MRCRAVFRRDRWSACEIGRVPRRDALIVLIRVLVSDGDTSKRVYALLSEEQIGERSLLDYLARRA